MIDSTVYNLMEKEVKKYINDHCIFRVDPEIQYVENFPKGKIPGKNPMTRNTYRFMLRRLTHNAAMLNHTSALIMHKMTEELKIGTLPTRFQFAGLETGSLPLITGLQQYMYRYDIEINAFTVRKERKSHGLFNFIEGKPTEDPVILVDDLIHSGITLGRCADTIQFELGLPVVNQTFTIVQFEPINDPKNHSLFNYNDFDIKLGAGIDYWLPEDCQKSENKRKDYR